MFDIRSMFPVFSPEEAALLVIDMQNDFVNPQGKFKYKGYNLIKNAASIISDLEELLSVVRVLKIPIVYTKSEYRHDYLDASLFERSRMFGALKKDSWGAEIIQQLKPKEEDFIIAKSRYDAFYGTNLEIVLRALKRQVIIVTGVTTNGCVESTVRSAYSRDFYVIVVSNCTAASTTELKESALKSISHAFGIVVTSKEIIDMMTKANRIS